MTTCKKGHDKDQTWVDETGDWCGYCISCDEVEGCEDLQGLNEEG